jgi:hypothetical protein
VDRLFLLEKRSQLLREAGKFEEAETIVRMLIKRNPEHHGYHASLQVWKAQSLASVPHPSICSTPLHLFHALLSVPHLQACLLRAPLVERWARVDGRHFRLRTAGTLDS